MTELVGGEALGTGSSTAVRSSTLTLASVLQAAHLEPEDVLLIRHPLSNANARLAYESGQLIPYTSEQGASFPTQYRYWLTFVGEEGTSARLVACYENLGHRIAPEQWTKLFDLVESEVLSDLIGRLVIDWGAGARSWRQRGVMASLKPIVSILERQVRPFPGFERLVLTFAELDEVISQPRRYAAWHASMSAVSAIYVIANQLTGKLYVGSAHGEGGLLGRWTDYVNSYHGGNKKLVAEIEADPSTFKNFQFSVLQVLSRTATAEQVLGVESLYKRKMLSIPFGLNAN
jgi:hypothetical protein